MRIADSAAAPTDEQSRTILADLGDPAGWLAYIGGPGAYSGDASWNDRVVPLREQGVVLIPTWVAAPDGTGQPSQVLAALKAGGFTSGPVLLDLEDYAGAVNSAGQVCSALRDAGYRPLVYGQQQTLRQAMNLPPSQRPAGAWLADYPGGGVDPAPDLAEAPMPCVGWQYTDQGSAAGLTFDVSVIDPDGVGVEVPARQAPTPSSSAGSAPQPSPSSPQPSPAPAPTPTRSTGWELNVAQLPLLKEGAAGQPVRNVQALLDAHGGHVDIDGQFGPVTRAAVVEFQSQSKIATDGIVGPDTYRNLLGV